VAPQIDGKASPIGKMFDDPIPDSAMKPGGVGKKNRRTIACGLPYGKMVNPKQMHVQ
jgi:hypothetical protein